MKYLGITAAGLSASAWRGIAGPFTRSDFEQLVPSDKKLQPAWVNSLFARGHRSVYRGADLEKIGMPVGGICAGQLYLGGDGKLWHWGVFNEHDDTGSSGPHYANPLMPESPLDQGFALKLHLGGQTQVRSLDRSGWRDVSFIGEYPVGFVEYRDADCPVKVSLEAFSPFIPLNAEDSALPLTVMRFTIRNPGAEEIEAELAGWLENAVCLRSQELSDGVRRNRIVHKSDFVFLECTARATPVPPRDPKRPDIVFDDFEGENYQGWTISGTAFGNGPVAQEQVPSYQGNLGMHGKRSVNTHASAAAGSVEERDAAIGTLTSRTFLLERDYIRFLIGGGPHKGRTCMNLIVEEKVVRSATGKADNHMAPCSWDVRQWAGKPAHLQIVDSERGPWGNIGIDNIIFSDEAGRALVPLEQQSDFGSMGMALLESERPRQKAESRAEIRTCAELPNGPAASSVFDLSGTEQDGAVKPFGKILMGALSKKLKLKPEKAETVTFLVTWHFPNLKLEGLGEHQGRWYGRSFSDALAVAEYVTENFSRLYSDTTLWHQTWYDSTLPYWFLDRTFLNTSILATNTCFWLGNGRFYGWEGVGCCAGTCGHVWHYAQAVGRLFPVLERTLREQVDYGVAFDAATGRIRFRAEHNDHWAVDSQSGVILRTYREHQMSPDDAFLRRVWPSAKKALEFLMSKDKGADGIIDGPQHNTLDADWFGEVPWLSGLYLAALRAGEEMATEMGDSQFAGQCREIFERGRRNVEARLFNGEYYVQLADATHAKTVGSYNGCEIDQVFGQSWSWQLGLGRIFAEENTRSALGALWRYNFTPDVGPYRKVYKPGRWYAMAGEGGLLMCTWPRGESQRIKESFDFYFNECMTGFEYQVAGHMLAEGMLKEGLAVTRMIHDRYHASRRNPWNEVECGDHYARAMASFGVFLTACGYRYHGPKGHLGFAPPLTPENFRCAFTTAEGWGTYSQKNDGRKRRASIEVKWGGLRLKTLGLAANPERISKVKVTLGGKRVRSSFAVQDSRVSISFRGEVLIKAGQQLDVELS